MRLAYVVNNFEFFLSHRVPLAEAARSAGYEVFVVGPKHKSSEQVRNLGFKVREIYLNRNKLNPFLEMGSVISIWKVLREIRPDVIHGIALKAAIYSGFASMILGVPKRVHTITGLGYSFTKEGLFGDILRKIIYILARAALKNQSTAVIFQNPDDQFLFLKHGVVGENQAHLILGSGADIKKFTPPESRGLRPIILFASRMLRDKGVVEFVMACHILKKKGRDFEMRLVGQVDPGNPSSVSENEIAEWVKVPGCTWLGYQKDMVRQFREAHIVCLPSYREGLPLALIEAAACECAVITTDAPGCREAIQDGSTGFLVPVKDIDKLAEKIDQLVSDIRLCGKMGKMGRQRVVEKFSLDEVVRSTLKLYQVST